MMKTEEQIEKEKQQVAAMSNAKSNMTAALDRCETLEKALRKARSDLAATKKWIGPDAYVWHDRNQAQGTCHSVIDDGIEKIDKVL